MAMDVLKAAMSVRLLRGSNTTTKESLYTIPEAITDCEAFTNLDDNIFTIIRNSPDPDLDKARSLLDRIDNRDLYKCLGEVAVSHADSKAIIDAGPNYSKVEQDVIEEVSKKMVNASQKLLANGAKTDGNEREVKRRKLDDNLLLTKDDVIVEILHIHHGLKGTNPMDAMRFYRKADTPSDQLAMKNFELHLSPQGQSAKTGQQSVQAYFCPERVYQLFAPKSFQERWIRVYCKASKNTQPDKLCMAKKAFVLWKREYVLANPDLVETPGVEEQETHPADDAEWADQGDDEE